ncbi:unnamed protein product, partial [Coregonus sp. 'balchen']
MLNGMMSLGVLLVLLFFKHVTADSSADPCQHYTVLNDGWRATNNNVNVNGYHCDKYVNWQGWYRLFLGNTSVQMPERCVERYMCGTAFPMWLTDPHPQLSDGVVQRGVCGSFAGNCCMLRENPILVKACYGNYYVYKFVHPTACSLAYCAVPETITTTLVPETTTTTPVPDTTTTTTPVPETTTTTRVPETTTTTTQYLKPPPQLEYLKLPLQQLKYLKLPLQQLVYLKLPLQQLQYLKLPLQQLQYLKPPPQLVHLKLPLQQLKVYLVAAGLNASIAHLADSSCSAHQEAHGTVWYQMACRE